MLKIAILSVAVILALASWAGATTMTYSVVVNTTVSPKTFDIYAYCPGSAGLTVLYFDVAATGDISFLSGSLKAAQAVVLDENGDPTASGFSVYRNSGTRSSQLIHDVQAAQSTSYGYSNDPFLDSLVTQNLGNSTPYQIYHGTFSGNTGQIFLSMFDGAVLMNMHNGPWYGPGHVLGTTSQGVDPNGGGPIIPLTVVAAPATVVPEPATLSLLALSGLGLIRRRR